MSDNRYYLDVGGVLHVSTLETLRKSPTLDNLLPDNCEESVFFVDRDGGAFFYILNFLRNGTVHLSTEDRPFLEFLMGEAAFFGLRKMEAQIQKMLEGKKRVDMSEVANELRLIRQTLTSTQTTNAPH